MSEISRHRRWLPQSFNHRLRSEKSFRLPWPPCSFDFSAAHGFRDVFELEDQKKLCNIGACRTSSSNFSAVSRAQFRFLSVFEFSPSRSFIFFTTIWRLETWATPTPSRKSFRRLPTRFSLERTFRWRRTVLYFLKIRPKATPASRPFERSFRRSSPDVQHALPLLRALSGLWDSYPFFPEADWGSKFSARSCFRIRSFKPIEISRLAKSRDSRFFREFESRSEPPLEKIGFSI